ncbi:MAG: methyltransferase domain-containing protein [Schwartzia sp.]|nr:methyltransferase domain-containing protein [Schwartzia sp. (in: firmicutes)]
MKNLKERIKNYWARRVPSFVRQRLREFESEKRGLWFAEIARYLPKGKPLRILDVGTGTGFLACLLAAEGHTVTGIDLTSEMISRAEEFAKAVKVPAKFLVMDAECPNFPPESFDAIVTRNLTWTLPDLQKAYRSWHELLAKGGTLINFDADYCHEFSDAEDLALLPDHAHKLIPTDLVAENDEITQELCAYQKRRPEWDLRLLLDAGFSRVTVDAGVWKRVYAEPDEFYNPTPIFTIAAEK